MCVFNATPVPRDQYWIGVPEGGTYARILDSDAERYGGTGYSRQERATADTYPSHGYPFRLRLDLPPLAALFFRLER